MNTAKSPLTIRPNPLKGDPQWTALASAVRRTVNAALNADTDAQALAHLHAAKARLCGMIDALEAD